jgi:hypothetical protein
MYSMWSSFSATLNREWRTPLTTDAAKFGRSLRSRLLGLGRHRVVNIVVGLDVLLSPVDERRRHSVFEDQKAELNQLNRRRFDFSNAAGYVYKKSLHIFTFSISLAC